MNRSFFEEIQTFSAFWKKHRYCLSADSVEKGIRLLSTSSPVFRSQYSRFFLTKLLNAFCAFEQRIAHQKGSSPQQRGLFFRLFKTQQSENSALGIAVGIKLNGNTEFLSQERLLQAILHIIPGVVSVSQKAYQYRDDEAGLLFLYQEIEKKRGRGFAASDIGQLKKFLPKELEENVECYSPSLFLIRNEEEIFRNIVQMSREFHQPGDLPQVTISFQEQTPKGILRFSVVIVRLATTTTPTLKELSKLLPHTIQLIPEMTAEIGTFDKQCIKQANITLFEVESALFARKNSSIDLREVRLYVAKAIELMIGEFRDYNGGLFSKQHKQLRAIQEIVGNTDKSFLESLFYSFTPSHFQTFILPEAGKVCASLFLEAKQTPLSVAKPYELLKHHESSFSVVVIKTMLEHLKNSLIKEVMNFSFPLHQFGYADQCINGEYYLGLVYQYPTSTAWLDSIQARLNSAGTTPKQERKFLRINYGDGDPLSLNPQIGLDLRCRAIQKALFEGLTRIAPSGIPELAAAESVTISPDGLTYLFTLKKLQWSNGEEITAFQFERTWKKAVRSPSCLRPDFFYILQNARKAHFKQASIDDIGVKALNAHTLQVKLEHPASYFLEMLSHPLFFPLYEESGEPYVFCGPFTLHSWQRHQSIVLIKNPYYWDFENVGLEGIEISIIRDPILAFEKYEQGELDWIGGPFSLLPPEIARGIKDRMHSVETPAVSWLYCNLAHPLFSSCKVRRALAIGMDREELCRRALLQSSPLKTHLPKEISLLGPDDIYPAPDRDKAVALFEEGLRETGCTPHDLRLLHSHIPGQKELAIEVQRQWQEVFGIQIRRVEESWNTFSHQLDNRLIHFGSCYRHPFYKHPMYFFQIFYETTNIHNAFGWHSEKFNHFIDQAKAFPQDTSHLKNAELELLEQMPVIPIHGITYHYLARSDVKGIYFCQSGDVDFRWIYFEEEKK
ncbi:peptide ABC transporter substrate-binding protein [Chlamydiota bacterium]